MCREWEERLLVVDAPGESDAARFSVAIVSVRNHSLFLWC